MSALGDCKSLWEYDAIRIKLLTIKECTLIVRPRTKVVRRSRKHTSLITPCWVSTYECTTVNLKIVVRFIKHHTYVTFNSFSCCIRITRLSTLSNICFGLNKSLFTSNKSIDIVSIHTIITAIKVTTINCHTC